MNRSFKAPMKQIINHSNHQPNQSNKQTINRWIDQREHVEKTPGHEMQKQTQQQHGDYSPLHTCCEHASMRKGKHFIQSHRLHKNVTVETECAFRTPKAARRAARPKRSARFAPPSRLKLPRFARPLQAKARRR